MKARNNVKLRTGEKRGTKMWEDEEDVKNGIKL
jgi:hypothetical protein